MICIYHANCADGFAAATIVKHSIPDCEMVEGIYGEQPPCVANKDVIMVDFSYKRDVLLEMAKEAKSITILDHHASAERELVDLPSNVKAFFDMDLSGAGLAWNYFHANDMPLFIKHIQDRDLWKFEIHRTKDFSAGLFAIEYDFDVWDAMIYIDPEASVLNLRDSGYYIRLKQTKDINELIKNSSFTKEIDGHIVPVLNVPYMYASEAGYIMAEGQPFAATYYDTKDARIWSLRSTNEGLDVSLIAAKFGGGGHRNAAGFKECI